MANGIDAAVEGDEASHPQAVVDRLRESSPELEQLVTRDHAMLLRCQARNLSHYRGLAR